MSLVLVRQLEIFYFDNLIHFEQFIAACFDWLSYSSSIVLIFFFLVFLIN